MEAYFAELTQQNSCERLSSLIHVLIDVDGSIPEEVLNFFVRRGLLPFKDIEKFSSKKVDFCFLFHVEVQVRKLTFDIGFNNGKCFLIYLCLNTCNERGFYF